MRQLEVYSARTTAGLNGICHAVAVDRRRTMHSAQDVCEAIAVKGWFRYTTLHYHQLRRVPWESAATRSLYSFAGLFRCLLCCKWMGHTVEKRNTPVVKLSVDCRKPYACLIWILFFVLAWESDKNKWVNVVVIIFMNMEWMNEHKFIHESILRFISSVCQPKERVQNEWSVIKIFTTLGGCSSMDPIRRREREEWHAAKHIYNIYLNRPN